MAPSKTVEHLRPSLVSGAEVMRGIHYGFRMGWDAGKSGLARG